MAATKTAKATTKAAKAAAKKAAPALVPGVRPGSLRRRPSAMIYTLGDSWFTYPTLFDQGAPVNLIRALDAMDQPDGKKYFFNESGEPGATSEDLTSDWYWERLRRALRDPYDFLLVSMAGNDFVGTTQIDGKRHTRFGDYLLEYAGQQTGEELLDPHVVAEQMDKTLENVRKVFRLCEQTSANPSLQIVTHVYDYLIPTSVGARVLGRWQILGPWMYDDLVRKHVPPNLHPAVPKALLQQYKARLTNLAKDLNDHTKSGIRLWIADTQGTLTPGDTTQWINEIHPRNKGYEKLAQQFDAVLAPLRDALPAAAWRNWPQ